MGVVEEDEEEEVSLLFSSLNDVVFHSLPNPCPCLLLYAILLYSFLSNPNRHRPPAAAGIKISPDFSPLCLSRCVLSLSLSLKMCCVWDLVSLFYYFTFFFSLLQMMPIRMYFFISNILGFFPCLFCV